MVNEEIGNGGNSFSVFNGPMLQVMKVRLNKKGNWDGTKFLWMEMNRYRKRPSLDKVSREFPVFNFRAWFDKLLLRFRDWKKGR